MWDCGPNVNLPEIHTSYVQLLTTLLSVGNGNPWPRLIYINTHKHTYIQIQIMYDIKSIFINSTIDSYIENARRYM